MDCHFVSHVSKTEQFLGAQFCFYNIHGRSGLSFFISALYVLSAPLQTLQFLQWDIRKSPLSNEAWSTETRPLLCVCGLFQSI